LGLRWVCANALLRSNRPRANDLPTVRICPA
jgi:hypothetical protein